MTQVDLGLTGLTWLIRSLALMMVIKNLGRHRWPAARQWQHGRGGSGSGEMPAMLCHQVRLEAYMWAREELRVTGWSRAQARVRVRQRR
jgi:hypothetical protein